MISIGSRPKTLHEVSSRARNGSQRFDPAVLEFLDVFYANPASRIEAIAERPCELDATRDAYLSALGEHLARKFGLPSPAWTDQHGFDLRRPFFAGGLESLKATLLVESPTAFRRRLIFISKDALSRPRLVEEQMGADLDGCSGAPCL